MEVVFLALFCLLSDSSLVHGEILIATAIQISMIILTDELVPLEIFVYVSKGRVGTRQQESPLLLT